MKKKFLNIGLIFFLVISKTVSAQKVDIAGMLDKYNVAWDIPGPTSQQSMPIGNGDIGLNVWVETNGDLAFYISKTDAWGEETEDRGSWMAQGGVLMKLGLVHVSFLLNSFKKNSKFNQVLKLHSGEILINEGSGKDAISMKIWVDANNPVIHIEAQSVHPMVMNVKLDNWRLSKGDTIVNKTNRIEWYHQNSAKADEHIKNIVFGAAIKGDRLINTNPSTLQSNKATITHSVSIYPYTTEVAKINDWLKGVDNSVIAIDKIPLSKAYKAHQNWWDDFWHRSWIFISGDSLAAEVTQGYVLQRFVTACAGRGAYPIKFNGTIFNVDNPHYNKDGKIVKMNADFREWGGQYWFQNTRPMYWPRLMAGDFDIMMPLFKMYAAMLPANEKQVENYYHHDGAYFAETAPFWGGLLYMGPEVKENWTGHYFTPILELSMMMLDYYDYTGDKKFAQDILMPVASNGIEFFNKHFSRDGNGKLLLDPDNSIEMFWKVHNPAPDIAGLHAVLQRLIQLPSYLVSDTMRNEWKKFQTELPDLPTGIKDGDKILLPYTGPQAAKTRNFENPELYAIYPFRLFGLDKPDYEMALHTFNDRKFLDKGCWAQDPIQAAMLGLTDVAKEYVSFNLTRKDTDLKFPAFWARGHDYMPDEDNGGNGENGLQQMLMYVDGKKIILLPAWPKEWKVDFKLHAPFNTTIKGKAENGKITELEITPSSRKGDVLNLSGKNLSEVR